MVSLDAALWPTKCNLEIGFLGEGSQEEQIVSENILLEEVEYRYAQRSMSCLWNICALEATFDFLGILVRIDIGSKQEC